MKNKINVSIIGAFLVLMLIIGLASAAKDVAQITKTNIYTQKKIVTATPQKETQLESAVEIKSSTPEVPQAQLIELPKEIQGEVKEDYEFIVEVKEEETAESPPERKDSSTQPLLRVHLEPEKQDSGAGSATYYVTIENECESKSCEPQEYELVFESEQNELSAAFPEGSKGIIESEDKLQIPLVVQAHKKGQYVFRVYLFVQDVKQTYTKGLFTYEEKTQKQTAPLFEGEGFVKEKQSSSGKLVSITLLQNDEEIRGKIQIQQTSFALKGEIHNSEISFGIYDTKKEGFAKSVGSFNGEIKKFDDFSLLTGKLMYQTSEPWELSIMSKSQKIFQEEIEVDTAQTTTKTINKDEVVTIKKAESREAYIIPQEIEKKKLFGFIPNPWGDKILKIKLVEGEKITEQTVEEFGTRVIGDYEVSVGSLQNEDAIDVSLAKRN